MGTVSTTTYGLRHKKTGHLARLRGNSERFSEKYGYHLMPGAIGGYPEFEVDSMDTAALVLVSNTPAYNSTPTKPCWGQLKMVDYEVVKIERVVSLDITPCDVAQPVRFGRDVDHRKTPRILAERYLGRTIADEHVNAGLTYIAVRAPEGETLESLQAKCTNRPVFMGGENDYPELCLGAFSLPPEDAALFKDGDGVGLILTYFAR